MATEEELRKEKLFIEIIIKRQKMIEMAQVNGMNSKETIELSQELDKLLNKYQQMVRSDEKNQSIFHPMKWTLTNPFVATVEK